jgi:hypothetical protein
MVLVLGFEQCARSVVSACERSMFVRYPRRTFLGGVNLSLNRLRNPLEVQERFLGRLTPEGSAQVGRSSA